MVAGVLRVCLVTAVLRGGFLWEGFSTLLSDVQHRLDLKVLPVASLLPVLLHPVPDKSRFPLHSSPLLSTRLGLSSMVGVCGRIVYIDLTLSVRPFLLVPAAVLKD